MYSKYLNTSFLKNFGVATQLYRNLFFFIFPKILCHKQKWKMIINKSLLNIVKKNFNK